MASILVVDDDLNVLKLITSYLIQKGFNITGAKNGEIALEKMDKNRFDMVITDIMMPKIDGYELTKDIRSIDKNIPILMVTAKETFLDKRNGFLLGIDDYMTKPIHLDEMLLRINALLRRAKISLEKRIEVGNLCIDNEQRLVITKDGSIELPKKEFDLLFKLLSYPEKTFIRRQLMEDIWGLDSDSDQRTVDVHIKRLREKLDKYDDFKIVTVKGLGYKAVRKL